MKATLTNGTSDSSTTVTSSRLGRPGDLLRAEGAAMAAAAIYAYSLSDASWALFGLLLLAPDLGLLGYVVSRHHGARVYNLTHNLVLPLALGGVGWAADAPGACAVALIWVAHIGIDRAVGYGLKYSGDPRRTHLQRLAA